MALIGRRTLAAAFALLLTVPGLAVAQTQYGLGELLAPAFDGTDGLLLLLEDASVGPAAPLAPALLPLLDAGRVALGALRAVANATIVGATDGDAGSDAGTPDAVGVQSAERVVVDGVRVPGQNVTVPPKQIVVGTPGVDHTVHVPRVELPPRTVATPRIVANLSTPPVGVPGLTLRTPPVVAEVPPVATPPVRVATPPVGVAGQNLSADASGLALEVQRLRGTVYLGPLGSREYDVGPARVGAEMLPAEVPRRVEAATPPVEALPAMTLVDEPSRPVFGGHRVEVPAREVPLTQPIPLLPGRHVATLEVPAQRAETPGAVLYPGSQHQVQVPAQHVATLEVPGASHRVDEVVVTGERVVAPAFGHVADPFGDVDDLGYVGYGVQDDSSLYPFACTAVVGCAYGRTVAKPWVDYADAWADRAAATLDGELVVRVG